jgi:hypothetical protein
MNYEMLSLNYDFSEDYEMLFELLHNQIIVCFVDYNAFEKENEEKEPLYDVCITQRYKPQEGSINIGARGIGYIAAINKEEFIQQCKKRKLKFIP